MAAISVIPGCDPRSHTGGGDVGVVVIHGFTGCPASVSTVADALVAAGFDVEVPRLPGHGTTVEEMLTTSWPDWLSTVMDSVERVLQRCDDVVLVGQSMGATLALAAALELNQADSQPIGLACINPATRPRGDDVMEMLHDFIEDGIKVVPGEGSDIADPDSSDIAYPGTPLRPLLSFVEEGIVPIQDRYGELSSPLLLVTSRQDHVVDPADSVHLAGMYGGDVDHVWLERSFHVATRDYERDDVARMIVEFATTVKSAVPPSDDGIKQTRAHRNEALEMVERARQDK